jgi:hypothetical protein
MIFIGKRSKALVTRAELEAERQLIANQKKYLDEIGWGTPSEQRTRVV